MALGATSALGQQAPVSQVRKQDQARGYVITSGPQALKKKDGSWKFWVRIVNLDDLDHDIKASIQIATDRGFQQIVDSIPIVLKQKKSFICQVHYRPSHPSSTLFFRYVIADDPSVSPSVSSNVGSISSWFDESKPE